MSLPCLVQHSVEPGAAAGSAVPQPVVEDVGRNGGPASQDAEQEDEWAGMCRAPRDRGSSQTSDPRHDATQAEAVIRAGVEQLAASERRQGYAAALKNLPLP